MSVQQRRILARVGLVFFSSLITFAAAEGIFRFVAVHDEGGGDPEWERRYRHMNETIYMRSPIEGLIYEPKPSSSVEMEYGVAGFDAERRRWDGTAPDDPGERVRVAMLGDSLVWSELVAVSDSLPVQTELALGPDAYQVSNFGVTGYDTVQEAIYYEHRVRPRAPDVVVVVFCMNDLFVASGAYGRFATAAELEIKREQDRMFDRVARVRRETLDGVARAEEAEATFKLLARLGAIYRRATFDEQYVDEYTIAAADPVRVAQMRSALARLGSAIAEDGARPVLVISPILESWDRYHWAPIHEAVRAAGEAAGFTVHDPLEAWRGSERSEDMHASGDNLHYSEHGNRALARVIVGAVTAVPVVH